MAQPPDIEDLDTLFNFVPDDKTDLETVLADFKKLAVRSRPAPPADLHTKSPFRFEMDNGAAPLAPSTKHKWDSDHHDFTMRLVETAYGPGVEISGHELLTVLTSGATAPSRGSVLYGLPISPSVIPDARLVQLANLYTRYLFTEFTVSYRPTANATVNGSVLMFGDYDPSQNPSIYVGDGNLRYAYVHNVSEASVWQGQRVTVDDKFYKDLLYIDANEELRWCIQGNFWCLAAGNLPANTEFGKLWLDYKVVMAVPDMGGSITNPTSLQGVTVTIPTVGNVGGSSFTLTTPAGLTSSSYGLLIVRTAPTGGTTPNLRANLDAYNDPAAQQVPFQPGCAFWWKQIGNNNTLNLCLQPLVANGNGNPPAGYVVTLNTLSVASTFVADFYTIAAPQVN